MLATLLSHESICVNHRKLAEKLARTTEENTREKVSSSIGNFLNIKTREYREHSNLAAAPIVSAGSPVIANTGQVVSVCSSHSTYGW
jgi:hypothetical protein